MPIMAITTRSSTRVKADTFHGDPPLGPACPPTEPAFLTFPAVTSNEAHRGHLPRTFVSIRPQYGKCNLEKREVKGFSFGKLLVYNATISCILYGVNIQYVVCMVWSTGTDRAPCLHGRRWSTLVDADPPWSGGFGGSRAPDRTLPPPRPIHHGLPLFGEAELRHPVVDVGCFILLHGSSSGQFPEGPAMCPSRGGGCASGLPAATTSCDLTVSSCPPGARNTEDLARNNFRRMDLRVRRLDRDGLGGPILEARKLICGKS